MKKLLLLMCTVVISLSLSAQIKLAPIFTDNMVVQQSANVPIWGFGNSNSMVTILTSWAPKDTVRVRVAPDGQWKAILKTPSADMAAHTIRCNDKEINNVMLGEVWLCSGQSNMQWSVNHGILNGEEEASAATYPNIRIYQVPLRGADTPQLSLDAQWVTCTPKTVRQASAVGYFFARSLQKELNVPIGIISSAWGGTLAEPWIAMPSITDNAEREMIESQKHNPSIWSPVEAGRIYNQMIHPFVPFTLAGTIWYQGESNRTQASSYDNIMQSLINSWRKAFDKELPFYFVQIAPFNYTGNKDTYAAELREAQQKTATTLAKTGMVVVSDLVNDVNNIHPLNKQDVGARLSAYALAEVYGKNILEYKSPTYKSMSIKGNKAIIEFNNPTSAIKCSGAKIEGFKIAAEDGVFVDADAAINGNRVEVWSSNIKKPTIVRYCFDDTTCGNLKSAAGLPVAPFRTDYK